MAVFSRGLPSFGGGSLSELRCKWVFNTFSFNTRKASLRLRFSGAESPRFRNSLEWNSFAFGYVCFELQFATVAFISVFILQLCSTTVKSTVCGTNSDFYIFLVPIVLKPAFSFLFFFKVSNTKDSSKWWMLEMAFVYVTVVAQEHSMRHEIEPWQ